MIKYTSLINYMNSKEWNLQKMFIFEKGGNTQNAPHLFNLAIFHNRFGYGSVHPTLPQIVAVYGCSSILICSFKFENKLAAWVSWRFWALSFGPLPVRLACNLGHLFLVLPTPLPSTNRFIHETGLNTADLLVLQKTKWSFWPDKLHLFRQLCLSFCLKKPVYTSPNQHVRHTPLSRSSTDGKQQD